MGSVVLLVCAFCCFSGVAGYPQFQYKIPNGDRVPDPCRPGYWGPVGHNTRKPWISKSLNNFGKDFKRHNFKWTEHLCRMDSDGDGVTNGQELGDPSCVWSHGKTPEGQATSHPGINDVKRETFCLSLMAHSPR